MEVSEMTGNNSGSGLETGRWMYGEQVTERAPTRSDGAFYGRVAASDDDVDVDVLEEPERPGATTDETTEPMSISDDRELFRRIAIKQQKNILISRELAAVLEEIVGVGQQGHFIEEAVWTRLVAEQGEDEIRQAIEAVQEDIDDDLEANEEQVEPVEIRDQA